MDYWLCDGYLVPTYHKAIESAKLLTGTKGSANSLSFDYDYVFSQMLMNLQKSIKRTMCHSKRTKTPKSDQESSQLRNLGNQCFSTSAFDKALEFYTKSIAYALPNSEGMALGYANRSAVLYKMNCPQECLDNIERALPNYPDHLKSKLYNRQAECYSKLAVECKTEAKVWLEKVPAKDSTKAALEAKLKDCPQKEPQNFVVYKDCVVPKIKNRSKRYSCASDGVEVGYSEQFGRHLVATRNIDVGEVLIVEKPYFSFLDKDNLYSYCSFCTAFLWDGIPCDECVNAFYCSLDCKEKAWIEYHQMECTVSDLVKQYYMEPWKMNEGTRLLLLMHREAGGLLELKERVTKICGENLDGFKVEVEDEWYQGSKLESILCLMSHEDKLTQVEFQLAIFHSIRVVFYLLTCTDFFLFKLNREKTHDMYIIRFMLENPELMFTGKLLTKLSYIIRRNSFKSVELTVAGSTGLGKVTAGLLSLLNNNCHENTHLMFAKDRMVLHAIYPIKKGEQIFTCYRGSYCEKRTVERQQDYKEHFFFKCNCVACVEDWPMHLEVADIQKYILSIEIIWERIRTGHKRLNELSRSVFVFGDYGNIEELFDGFHRVIRVIYKELGVNSMEMRMILKPLKQLYLLTGNVKKHQNLAGVLK